MSSSVENPMPYQVIWSGEARRVLQELSVLARKNSQNAAQALAETLRTIQEGLTWVPQEWGEPYRDLEHLQLQVCIGCGGGMFIEYGIHHHRRLVIVNHVRLMKGFRF
jgi:hypothetical protein